MTPDQIREAVESGKRVLLTDRGWQILDNPCDDPAVRLLLRSVELEGRVAQLAAERDALKAELSDVHYLYHKRLAEEYDGNPCECVDCAAYREAKGAVQG